MKKWLQEEDDYVINNYGSMTAPQLAAVLGVTRSSVKNRVTKLGLKQSEEVRIKNCKIGQRVKGSVPPNKGKKMTEEMKDKYRHTFYKKGNKPHNTLPVGSVLINSLGYLVQKIDEPNKWDFVHRLVWFKINGEIPKGYNIQFKDRNKMNIAPSNLYIINKAENMRHNSIMNYPPEIRQLIRLTAKLQRKIDDYGKEHDE